MKPVSYMAIVLCVMLLLTGCSSGAVDEEVNESVQNKTAVQNKTEPFTRNTKIEDVINAPSFDGFGRLLFPTDEYYYSGDTLEELGLTYYSHIDPDETVEIVNTLRERAADGQTIFYDIYTDEEKAADPAKEDTGLFFFKGVPGEKFAICNAGGALCLCGGHAGQLPSCAGAFPKGLQRLRSHLSPRRTDRLRGLGKSHPLHL